jgi:hypothetical protein
MRSSVTPSTEYEFFLGRFIDEVQEGDRNFGELQDLWLAICPREWRDRFAQDLDEIETLLRDGTLAVAFA